MIHELEQFDESLAQKPRWLVLNKIDLFTKDELGGVCNDIVSRLGWEGPVYQISSATGAGTRKLMVDVMTFIEELNE